MTEQAKPGRPLGVTIAIILSVCLFSLFPIAQLGLVVLVQHQVNSDLGGTGGITMLGVDETMLLVQMFLRVAFLVVAFFAWRGRPPVMRFVFMAFILILTVLTIAANLLPSLTTQTCTQLPCDSSAEYLREIARLTLLPTILVPLYVVWYLNRGPARAFYRGYYLPDPDAQPDSNATS
jgi:hypothetical protein